MSTERKAPQEIREAVRRHYAGTITGQTSCCGPQTTNIELGKPGKYAALAGYTENELAGLPESVSTFGCGNPVNLAGVKPGETVLDLGSGAGLDLILAARKVGPTGRVIGLDMTDEMIAVCRRNLEQAGVVNGEVRKGLMEQMPVADGEVDWIISNCVINLSPEKEKVFAEAFRVLKPGGRLLVSDIVTIELPESLRGDLHAWAACLAGAVDEEVYLGMMRAAGFTRVEVLDKLVYDRQSLGVLAGDACGCGGNSASSPDSELVGNYADRVASVKVYGEKPA